MTRKIIFQLVPLALAFGFWLWATELWQESLIPVCLQALLQLVFLKKFEGGKLLQLGKLGGAFLIAFVCYSFVGFEFTQDFFWHYKWKQKSIRLLKSARTTNELRDAIASGAFVSFPDGAWLAIRHGHTHAGGAWSESVALDSEGRWYESRYVFCGALSIVSRNIANEKEYALEQNMPADDKKYLLDSLRNYRTNYPDVYSLMESTKLADSRRYLQKLEFKQIDPDF